MKEIRVIFSHEVRDACIEHRWFTCGSIEEYELFLESIYAMQIESKNITTTRLSHIANQIKQYSNTEYNVECIMFVLANSCCKSFFSENN